MNTLTTYLKTANQHSAHRVIHCYNFANETLTTLVVDFSPQGCASLCTLVFSLTCPKHKDLSSITPPDASSSR